MKALLLHARHYRSEVTGLSNMPEDIEPEKRERDVTDSTNAITVLVTIEQDDSISSLIPKLAEEVRKFCSDTGHMNVVILPFGHLSNRLADSKKVLQGLDLLEKELRGLEVKRAHFGSDKSLLLDVFGHKGNVRYREF